MIRPFYRSRLFWLGLPGMVFLLWGWIAGINASLEYFQPATRYGVQAGHSKLSFYSSNHPAEFFHYPAGTWDFRVHSEARGSLLAPGIVWVDERVLGYGARGIEIAAWTIFLTYIVIWMSSLAGWQRRKSRLLKLHASPPP